MDKVLPCLKSYDRSHSNREFGLDSTGLPQIQPSVLTHTRPSSSPLELLPFQRCEELESPTPPAEGGSSTLSLLFWDTDPFLEFRVGASDVPVCSTIFPCPDILEFDFHKSNLRCFCTATGTNHANVEMMFPTKHTKQTAWVHSLIEG